MIDCAKQEESEDNYNNKLRQKLVEHSLYRKNGATFFIILYCQLHRDIVTIVMISIVPFFNAVHRESDVVCLLSILHLICVQNLTGSKVNPYLEQLKILSSTLSYGQTKGISNHDFDEAVHDQVLAAQSQCGAFVFGDNCHAKILSDDGFFSLKDYSSFDDTKKDKYDKFARELMCSAS